MDRVAIKEQAKKMIKDNKWYIWKPLVFVELIIFAILFVIGFILGILKVDENTMTIIVGILSFFVGLFESAFMIGYAKYVLEFTRGNKMEWKETINYAKSHLGIAIITSLLVGLIIIGCSILLVIPGIIAAIGLMFYEEVCADNPEMKAMDIIHKSWEMTKGHKMDLFVMGLSFIGWAILASLTFGILYIWRMPYMVVAFTLAYEELKK